MVLPCPAHLSLRDLEIFVIETTVGKKRDVYDDKHDEFTKFGKKVDSDIFIGEPLSAIDQRLNQTFKTRGDVCFLR